MSYKPPPNDPHEELYEDDEYFQRREQDYPEQNKGIGIEYDVNEGLDDDLAMLS
jgi:hypothetical protein